MVCSPRVAQRRKVVERWLRRKRGATYQLVARECGVSPQFVRKWVQRWEQGLPLEQEAPRSGRPRTLEHMSSALNAATKRKEVNTAAKVKGHLGLQCSVRTVRRQLNRICKQYKRSTRVRRLTATHMAARHAFATRFRREGQWQRVVFTDSAYFYADQGQCRWVDRQEVHLQEFWRHPIRVHAYAGICRHGKIPLVFVAGTTGQKPSAATLRANPKAKGVCAPEYMEWLGEHLVPHANRLFADSHPNQWLLLQDGAKPHKARSTQRFLQDILPGRVHEWVANSPDFNPIENCWKLVKDKVQGTHFTSVEQLKRAVKRAWDEIPQEMITKKLIGGMYKRMDAAIKAKGARTKY